MLHCPALYYSIMHASTNVIQDLEQDFLDYKMYTLAGESASPANSRPEGAVVQCLATTDPSYLADVFLLSHVFVYPHNFNHFLRLN
jgi:hypothetical protein